MVRAATLLSFVLAGVASAGLAATALRSGGADAWERWQSGRPLRVGYAIEPPFAFVRPDGEVSGEAPSVLGRALAALGGGPVDWVQADFGRLLDELAVGRIDIIAAGLFITPERAERVRFSRPTAQLRPGLLVRAGAPLGVATLADVVRHPEARLAVIEGSVEAAEAAALGMPTARLQMFPDAQSAATAVRQGLADVLVLSAVSLRVIATQDPEGALRVVAEAGEAEGALVGRSAFAFRPGDEALADAVDGALADLLGTPEHLALVAPFGFTAAEVEPVAAAAGQRGEGRP